MKKPKKCTVTPDLTKIGKNTFLRNTQEGKPLKL